jgi:hypothetical protein
MAERKKWLANYHQEQFSNKLMLIIIYWNLSFTCVKFAMRVAHLIGGYLLIRANRISGIMVSFLVSSTVDSRGFEPRSCRTKDDKICFCYYSDIHAALRNKSKDCVRVEQHICLPRTVVIQKQTDYSVISSLNMHVYIAYMYKQTIHVCKKRTIDV